MLARSWRMPTVLWTALALAGCSMQQQAAERAVASAEQTLEMAGPAAERYVPELYQEATAQLAKAHAALDAKLYKEALTEAQGAAAKAGDLAAAVAAKKQELSGQWTALKDSLPAVLKTLETRVAALSRGGRMPAGVTRAKVSAGRSAVGEMKQAWTRATQSFTTGDLLAAVTTAQGLRARADTVMASLGMKLAAL